MTQRLLPSFLALFMLLSIGLQGQRNCGSMEYLQMQIEKDPSIQENLDQLEKFTQNFSLESNSRSFSGGILTIPVVVHVVHNINVPAQNVSDAQIQSQIDVLTDDFRRKNADASNTPTDYEGVAADTHIEFCLADITRTSTNVSSFVYEGDPVKFSNSGGAPAQNSSQYLNLWVCNLAGTLLGYAQFPGGAAITDGVVIDYAYFGTIGTATAPFNLGRTATHEVGHWLNLRHIWGDGDCRYDDEVADTPSAGQPNYTGNPCSYPGPNTCREKGRNPKVYDMFQNYMDYSDDACMNLFTLGQEERMWAAINDSKSSLLSASCDGAEPTIEICDNGLDDDGDQNTDCDDSDCSSHPACSSSTVEICDNGIDDDGDQAIDCDDSDCSSHAACQQSGNCDAPTGLTHQRAKGGREGILSWNATSGATSYFVEVYSSSNSLIAVGSSNGTSVRVRGLTKNAQYTWQVKSICGSDESDWASSSFSARVSDLGLDNFVTNQAIMLSPNPASKIVNIYWDFTDNDAEIYIESSVIKTNENIEISVFDLSGRTVAFKKFGQTESSETTLDVSNFNKGLYLISIKDEYGEVHNQKLIVQ